MATTIDDAAYDDYLSSVWEQEMHDSIRDSVLAELAADDQRVVRLRHAMRSNPVQPGAATHLLEEASSMRKSQWVGALTLSFAAVEVSGLHLMVRPIITSSIHHAASAKLVSSIAVRRQLDDWPRDLSAYLEPIIEVRITDATRPGATIPLTAELRRLGGLRNGAMHRGEGIAPADAATAIDFATFWLAEIYGAFVHRAGLIIDNEGMLRNTPEENLQGN